MPHEIAPMVRFDKVTKSYGSFVVLDQLDLDIAAGEKVAIIGLSGLGQDHRAADAHDPREDQRGRHLGRWRLLTSMQRNGGLVPADPRHLRRMRGKIGMVFQHFNLFPHMTALKNCIEAPCTVLKLSKAEAEAREGAPGDGRPGGQAESLSGTALRRAAAARRHCPGPGHVCPKVMLFDEVTSALDPELVGEVLNVIRRLGAEFDLTMLMVTHQMGFAKEFADRVCFFYGGRICEQGPPDRLFGAPENERARDTPEGRAGGHMTRPSA